jgi:DNA-binding response OmpR family regulator
MYFFDKFQRFGAIRRSHDFVAPSIADVCNDAFEIEYLTACVSSVFVDGAFYDLVILDLDMPGMDGRSVMEELKSSDATARIPVVVLTGATRETAETELIEQGPDDHVRKPIDPTRFTAHVKAVLRRARS